MHDHERIIHDIMIVCGGATVILGIAFVVTPLAPIAIAGAICAAIAYGEQFKEIATESCFVIKAGVHFIHHIVNTIWTHYNHTDRHDNANNAIFHDDVLQDNNTAISSSGSDIFYSALSNSSVMHTTNEDIDNDDAISISSSTSYVSASSEFESGCDRDSVVSGDVNDSDTF